MKKIILYFLLLAFTLIHREVLSDDLQLWTEVKVNHQFGDSPWYLNWGAENRWGNDISDYIFFNTTLGFDYKALKWIKTGLYYRFEKVTGKPRENRIFPQFVLGPTLGPVHLTNRHRFEFRFFPEDFRFRYRMRVKAAIPIKSRPVGFSPFISEEIFVETQKGGFNQNRFAVGNSFIFLKGKIALDLYYMLRRDKPTDPGPWKTAHVIGTSLAFKY